MCIGHGQATATLIERGMSHLVYLALGTNLGDRLANLNSAISAMPRPSSRWQPHTFMKRHRLGVLDQPAFLNR